MTSPLDQINKTTATYIHKKLIDNIFNTDPFLAAFALKPKDEFEKFRDWVNEQRAIEESIEGINGT